MLISEGILARAEGWQIIMRLQKLVDDGKLCFEYLIVTLNCVLLNLSHHISGSLRTIGQHARFRADKEIILQFVKHYPAFSDLLPCVLQEVGLCIVLYCIVLYCIVLYCIVLYCITL